MRYLELLRRAFERGYDDVTWIMGYIADRLDALINYAVSHSAAVEKALATEGMIVVIIAIFLVLFVMLF